MKTLDADLHAFFQVSAGLALVGGIAFYLWLTLRDRAHRKSRRVRKGKRR